MLCCADFAIESGMVVLFKEGIMANRFLVLILTFVFVSVFAAGAFAFDDSRKGFVIGISAGPSLTSFTQTIEFLDQEETSDRENSFGAGTDFRIGYGPNENLLIYYKNGVTWFSMENALGDNVIVANGVGGVGVSYFLTPEAPSFFLTGGLGFSFWMLPFEEGTDTWIGLGLSVGAGYEFAPHWVVEASAMYGNPSDEAGGLTATTNALGFMLTIGYLGY